jgi:hypothetical protein
MGNGGLVNLLSTQRVSEHPSTPVSHVPDHPLDDESAVRVSRDLKLLPSEFGESCLNKELTVCSVRRKSHISNASSSVS